MLTFGWGKFVLPGSLTHGIAEKKKPTIIVLQHKYNHMVTQPLLFFFQYDDLVSLKLQLG